MQMMNQGRPTMRYQKGYMLLAVMLLITIMLIVLAAEAPRIAQQIKRSKEEELVNRGTQYAIAIKKFFHKTGNYPTSLEQLEDTNHLRFLRKKYTDPMTGEANWKLVHLGEAEIPIAQNRAATLQGSSSLGSLSTTPGGQQNTPGNPTQQNPPAAPTGFSQPSGQQPTLQGGNPLGSLSTQNISNGLGGAGQQFGGGAIIGVASVSKQTGIKEFNGKSNYDEWLFVYDPRLEQAAAAGGIGGSATAGVVVAAPRGEGAGATGGTGGTGGAGAAGGTGASGGTGPAPSGTPTPAPAVPR